MRSSADVRDLVLRSGQALGTFAGSSLGILLLVITISEVRNGNQAAALITFALPLAVLVGGAAAGRLCCKWMAAQILNARGFVLKALNGVVLGAIIGVILVVTLGELFYLAEYWLNDLNFRGGVPAILENVAMLLGFLGGLVGAAVGLAFGLFAALVTHIIARRASKASTGGAHAT